MQIDNNELVHFWLLWRIAHMLETGRPGTLPEALEEIRRFNTVINSAAAAELLAEVRE